MTVAITQPDKRGTSKSGFSRNFAALGKWDENSKSYRYVKSMSSKTFADNFLEVERADTGKYVLYTKYLWNGVKSGQGVVSAYSLDPVSIKDCKGVTPDQFLSDIMYDHASQNPKRRNLEGNDWLCSDILLNEGGFSYFVANVDQGSNKKYGVTMNEAEYANNRLYLQDKYKGRGMIEEEVSAGKPFVAVAELLSANFPQSISNPTPKVVPLM